MRFIETPIFTREVRSLFKQEEYRGLQLVLLLRPEQGDLIPGTGGLRKIRWGAKGRGKRGARVIYYWHSGWETFYMLLVYIKSKQEDLTPEQVRILKRLVREEFK